MTFRTLRRTLLVAFGVAVLASAGQLGLGYGLGILRFGRAFDHASVNHWPAQLTWLAWFAMTATMIGAATAGRTATAPGTGVRVATAAAATLGGAAVAPLSMVPAQAAQVPSVDPVLSIGISALLGAVVGFFAALAVLGPRPIRWNLAAVVCAGWLLALASVIPSLGPTDPMPAVRLGAFDPAWLSGSLSQRLAIVTMPALALVAGAVTGGLARWLGNPLPVVASCGIAGPAMLSLAYLIAGPGSGADRYQTAPYWGVLAATVTGLLGSVLAATIRWPVLPTGTPPAADRGDGDPPGAQPESPAAVVTATGGPGHLPAPEQPARPPEAIPRPAEVIPRRPTTEDFWPSVPADAPAGSGSVGAQPAEARVTDLRQGEVGETAAPAARTGRIWQRLFRRSDPGDSVGPSGPDDETPREPAAASIHAEPETERGPARNEPVPEGPAAARPAAARPATDRSAAVEPAANPPITVEPATAKASATKATRNKPARNKAAATKAARDDAARDDAARDGATGDEPAAPMPRQRERRERRGRARTESEVPAADAEYVDWVSGLRGRRPQRGDQAQASGSTPPQTSSGGQPSE